MRPLKIVLDMALQIFVSWTLAYELCLLFNAPAIGILVPFFLILSAMILVSARYWKAREPEPVDWAVLVSLLLISFAAGAFTLVILRPDPDDSLFFYRALAQLGALTRPFSIPDSPLDTTGIMIGTVLHHMTSYEVLAAMAAKLFRLEPLWVYYDGMPFVAAAALPFVYYLLYRQFGIGKSVSVAATVLALLFLLIDGNVHHSFGNFGLVRLWQGKCIVVTLLLPATFFLTRSFLLSPSRIAFARLAMIGICGIGLSEVGLYLIPMMVLAVSLAWLMTTRLTLASIKLAALTWASMWFPLMIGALLVTGILPQPRFTSILARGFSYDWWHNLQLVVDSPGTMIRDLLILFLVPLIALKGRLRWLVISFCAVLLLLFANPIMGRLWIDVMYPVSHWRMAYLLPLPLLFGLIAPALAGAFRDQAYAVAIGRVLLVATVITSVVAACKSTVVYAVRREPTLQLNWVVGFKSPLEYQFRADELSFVRTAMPDLRGKDVLGPDDVNYIICLLDPTIRLAVTRSDYTTWGFENAGRPGDGQARVVAQTMISSCADSPEGRGGLRRCIANGVNAIVSRDCGPHPNPLPAILSSDGMGTWKEVHRDHGYVLYVKTTSEWEFLSDPHP